MLSVPGENTELYCKHNVSAFSMISWYQRPLNDSSMRLVAYVVFKHGNVESPFMNYFNISGDGEKHSTLHLVKLRAAEHTAVYYCAASKAQCTKYPHAATKTSTNICYIVWSLMQHSNIILSTPIC